jgi:hypothetical protein
VIVAAAGVALVLAAPVLAVPPVITSLTQTDRHASATLSAPRADIVTIYFATKPDRATEGSFLEENIKTSDLLTDDEIASGRWSSEDQLDPGTYYVMLKALPDFGLCYDVNAGDYDPACANGFSDVSTLNVPTPASRYAVAGTAFKFLREAHLSITATPLGENRPYRVCTTTTARRRLCVPGVLEGFSWSSSASDSVTVRTRSLPALATFTWYVGSTKVGTKRLRVH